MTIQVTERAEKSFLEIKEYITTSFGERRCEKFIKEVDEAAKILLLFPKSSQREPLLSHRKKEYRSAVIGEITKMVYFIEDDTIFVVDFWVCRRNPKILTQGL